MAIVTPLPVIFGFEEIWGTKIGFIINNIRNPIKIFGIIINIHF